MKIAITGASGFISTALIPRLKAAGHTLLLVGRNNAQLQAKYPAEQTCDYEHFAAHITCCDAVIHTAVMNNDAKANAEAFHAANVSLPVTLATQAAQAGVPLFINFTTLQALEPPFRSNYARTKYEGEQAVATIAGIRVVHLRLPAVYAGEFRGKLAVLNKFPGPVRSLAFIVLAALRPTLHIDRLEFALNSILADTHAQSLLVTDTQAKNWAYRLLNRMMDLGFAISVLLILWPLLVWAAIAIRRDSPGPVIFKQQRIGRHGRIFICYKFRTMALGVREAGTHEVSAAAVTKVGQFLRRTRIDELPQAWNIFRNDMSLIGPRPCLPVQSELVEWRRKLGVLAIKPGISGLAQVRGVDMSNPEKLARLDAEYVARQSLLLDLKILIATLRGSGSKDYVQKTSEAS